MLARILAIAYSDLWWVGVLLSIFSALFGSLGDNLIKLSFTKEELAVEAGRHTTNICCRPLWWIGMLCITVLNTGMTMSAYAFADASLTIPFAGLHICFNVGFAWLLNKEQFTMKQVGFTFIILIGVTIVLIAGNHDTMTYSVDQIAELYTEPGYIGMTIVIVFLLCIELPIALLHRSAKVRCFGSSALVGTVAAITQVTAKVTSECVSEAISGKSTEVFSHWVFYASLMVLVAAALAQLFLLNRALSLFNAFVVVPIYNSLLIVLGSLYAAIMFQEYTRFSQMSEILMPIGVLSTGVGVALLAHDHNPEATLELALGSSVDGGEIALMPRSQSFSRSPIFDDDELESIGRHSPSSFRQSRSYTEGMQGLMMETNQEESPLAPSNEDSLTLT